MSTTIEQLEVDVNSNASSATSGIDSLTNSLTRLKNATSRGVTGLSTIANQVKNLGSAFSALNTSKIEGLTTSLSRLKDIEGVKVSSTIGNQLKSIGEATSTLDSSKFSNITELVSALGQLNSLQKAGGLSSIITQLKKLPEVVTSINSLDVSTFASQISSLNTSMSSLSNVTGTTSTGLNNVSTSANTAASATKTLSTANATAGRSYTDLWSQLKLVYTSLKTGTHYLASWINTANSYIEDINLFTVSMGEYAEEAQAYATKMGEALGFDPGDFMRSEGTFNTIITGFGVASDQAYKMSKNLTQLGYDISSFFNISVEDAMAKLQSGISGELEPLRRIGYDLSVARLQQEAYNLGINESVSSMTQAEKAQLRYYAIMKQVSASHTDMARTINAPANQLRVLQAQATQCARALGNIFIPVLNAILPYAIAVVKVLRLVAEAIAGLFGYELPEADLSGIGTSVSDASTAVGDLADSAGDVGSNLGDATKAAKKLKTSLLGIDELNVLSPDDSSSSVSGGTVGGSGGSGVGTGGTDLGIVDSIGDIWDGLWDQIGSSKADEIFNNIKSHMNEILAISGTIIASLAAWKIAKGFTKFIESLKAISGFTAGTGLLGLLMLAADMQKFFEYLNDIIENGADISNVTGLIGEFAGMLGDAMLILGQVKTAGALKAIQGVLEIVSGIADIAENGLNMNNALTVVRGISNLTIAIGLIKGNFGVVGVGLALQGITTLIPQILNVIEAIRTGDWSGVDKVALVTGAVSAIAGIVMIIVKFKKVKDTAGSLTESVSAISEVSTVTEGISTATGGLSTKLTSLAKNLGMGLIIIAEIAAAALLIVGAIALLGVELGYVVTAWTPVIDNSSTAITAITMGVVILAAVGIVTALLGGLGTALLLPMLIGIAFLAEIGAAAVLFLAEILVIGLMLGQINDAWAPVLANGETVETGITKGSELLLAIGVVTAALGVLTVASAGLLPVAIGLGTALLVELAAATIAFCESLIAVANEMGDRLAPTLEELDGELPDLNSNLSDFVDFMCVFAEEVVRYTAADAVAGIAATIDTIIGWFTEDPIEKLSDDVENIHDQTVTLTEKLEEAVPELETATGLLSSYVAFLSQMEDLAGNEFSLGDGIAVNMNAVGQNIVTGFAEGLNSKAGDMSTAASTLISGFNAALLLAAVTTKTTVTNWAKNLKNWFTNKSYGGICADTWKTYGKQVVTGFGKGISATYTNSKSTLTTWGSKIVNWFNYANSATKTLAKEFEEIGKNVIQGFINGESNNTLWNTAKAKIEEFGKQIIQSGKKGLNEASPSKAFKEIGAFVIEGFNIGLQSMMGSSYSLMGEWTSGVSAYSPTVGFAVDTTPLDKVNSNQMLNSAVVSDVRSSYTVTAEGFADGIETFYRQYVEPTLKEMASDVKRQADKNEQTVVKIGGKTLTNAVTTQRKANGYSFA